MSINMANVKSITLGGVQVKKIADKNGRILWGNEKQSATINITVGEGQDMTTTQYYNRIVLPSLSSIKTKVENKIGTTSSSINVTKVELDLSTLYWASGAHSSTKRPYFSLSTSSPSYFGGGSDTTSAGRRTWASWNLDITSYLKNSSTVPFYGYSYEVDYSPHSYDDFQSYSGYYPSFLNSTGSGKPTFTLVVTYEI